MRRALVGVLLLATGVVAGPAGALPAGARLTQIANLTLPVAMSSRPGDEALYVAEKVGTVIAIRNGTVDPTPVLDLTGQLSQDGDRGLLGLTFSPDGSRLYANFQDPAGTTHVAAFRMSGGVADPASRRDILVIPHPTNNHYGGTMAFGRDGYLYISHGDGGCCGDPFATAQRLDTLLGKMLRIDPRPDEPFPYRIPATNPFRLTPGARREIWAYGLRNPWRWSFDPLTGDMWIGDVGQDAWEEVDFAPGLSLGGENYGWSLMEGTHRYNGDPPANHVPPIYEYGHAVGCSVTGGVVYRGTRIPALQGTYVFADFCAGSVKGLRNGGPIVISSVNVGVNVPLPTAFGQDNGGEIYVLSLFGGVYRFDPV